MSDFRFGSNDYRMNIDWEHQGDDFDFGWDGVDWSKVEWVEIDGTKFENVDDTKRNTRHERTCKWETVRGGSSIKATECGQLYDWYPLDIPKHCPNCGAKVIKND